MNLLAHILPTLVDLLSIVVCVGLLATELWVIPHKKGDSLLSSCGKSETVPFFMYDNIWRLLGLTLAALTLTSLIVLLQRSAEMADTPWSDAFSIVPLVLTKTHFGLTWWVRTAALLALWAGWYRGIRSRTISLFPESEILRSPFHTYQPSNSKLMFVAAICLVWCVSAASHAADWGDFTLSEGVSWLHIMAGSLWVGGILAFALVVRRGLRERQQQKQALFAACAGRLSRLAGIALALVLLTGIYNVWRQLERFSDLWSSDYGRIILIKLVLVGIMATMGASSRYFNLPFLCRQSAMPLPLRIWQRWRSLWKPRQRDTLVCQFNRRMTIAAWLSLGVLVCAALLGHAMPPKQHVDAVGMDTDRVPVITRPVSVSMTREGYTGSFMAVAFPVRPDMLKHGNNPS